MTLYYNINQLFFQISSAVPKPKYGDPEGGMSGAGHAAGGDTDYTQAWQTYNTYWSQMAAYNTQQPPYYDPAAYYA